MRLILLLVAVVLGDKLRSSKRLERIRILGRPGDDRSFSDAESCKTFKNCVTCLSLQTSKTKKCMWSKFHKQCLVEGAYLEKGKVKLSKKENEERYTLNACSGSEDVVSWAPEMKMEAVDPTGPTAKPNFEVRPRVLVPHPAQSVSEAVDINAASKIEKAAPKQSVQWEKPAILPGVPKATTDGPPPSVPATPPSAEDKKEEAEPKPEPKPEEKPTEEADAGKPQKGSIAEEVQKDEKKLDEIKEKEKAVDEMPGSGEEKEQVKEELKEEKKKVEKDLAGAKGGDAKPEEEKQEEEKKEEVKQEVKKEENKLEQIKEKEKMVDAMPGTEEEKKNVKKELAKEEEDTKKKIDSKKKDVELTEEEIENEKAKKALKEAAKSEESLTQVRSASRNPDLQAVVAAVEQGFQNLEKANNAAKGAVVGAIKSLGQGSF